MTANAISTASGRVPVNLQTSVDKVITYKSHIVYGNYLDDIRGVSASDAVKVHARGVKQYYLEANKFKGNFKSPQFLKNIRKFKLRIPTNVKKSIQNFLRFGK